jgi:hypothetical protein
MQHAAGNADFRSNARRLFARLRPGALAERRLI